MTPHQRGATDGPGIAPLVRPGRLTDEACLEAIRLLEAHQGNKDAAARAADLTPSAFRHRLARAAQRGFMGTKPVLPGYEIRQTSAELDGTGNLIRQWVQQHREPGEEFTLPDGHIVKGVSALTDADGRIIQQWVKTRADTTHPDVVAALKAVFDGYAGRAELIEAPRRSDERLLSVYPIADQHNGLLAWGRETGESYDLAIGVDRLRRCAAQLVAQAPPSRQAIILNLGDWQHTDDQRNMTPRSGNVLDVDSRYFKILTTGVQLMVDIIDLALQKHERVLVRNIPGNHDPHASVALTVALAAFFARNPRVTVDDDPGAFFFHRFGASLIGATHGHNIKPRDMAMTMATSRREDWGATRFHYFYFGHIHHQTALEVGDVVCESFRTLAANDAHHHAAGFRSGKSLTSITIEKDAGEIGRHRVNIPPPARPG